jgi:hypothetical protein
MKKLFVFAVSASLICLCTSFVNTGKTAVAAKNAPKAPLNKSGLFYNQFDFRVRPENTQSGLSVREMHIDRNTVEVGGIIQREPLTLVFTLLFIPN